MIRLYKKELRRLKIGQKLALVIILENGKKITTYHEYIGTKKLKDPIYSSYGRFLSLKNLKTNKEEYFFIKSIGQKNQKKWNIVYGLNDGSWHYVTRKYLAKLSNVDQSNMIANLLS
ncbi:hypothetical protein D3C87_80570 [compost metagenome]